ncbi:MAG: hypothetical protein O3B13_11370 [Planctomycetota bacterium]|nr:hypothetical protein [Planctomycetota bacterium]MDA1163691.1 hypothetical protein [Planctomycetota bacterium]
MSATKVVRQNRALWQRRLPRFVVASLLFLLALRISGWDREIALSRARTALSRHDLSSAESWLAVADFPGATTGESAFLHARVHRKLGLLDNMDAALQTAQDGGFDTYRIQLEHLLARAQCGNVAPLESKLATLLVAGEDLQEICEAFVVGCLASYRLDEAMLMLDQWQADFPGDAQPYFLRGRIYEFRNETDLAEASYRRAIECWTLHCAAQFGLGRLLTDSAQQEAISHFEICARYHIDPQPGLVAISRCQRLLGNLPEALQAMQQAMKSNAQKIELSYRLLGEPTESALSQAPAEFGQVMLALKDFAAAERWFLQALDANPNDWRTRYSLTIAQRQEGKLAEAAINLKQVEITRAALEACDLAFDTLRSDSGNVEARFLIGRTLLEHVSQRQGRIWLQSVLRYSPSHEAARAILDSLDRDSETSHD